MRAGDLLEILAACAAVAAAYLWRHSVALALVVAALCLVYFAQVASAKELRLFGRTLARSARAWHWARSLRARADEPEAPAPTDVAELEVHAP